MCVIKKLSEKNKKKIRHNSEKRQKLKYQFQHFLANNLLFTTEKKSVLTKL